MKILRFAFFGLVAGFVLSQLADQSVWLEMRVNTGLFLPVAALAAAVVGALCPHHIPAVPVLVLEILFVGLIVFSYGFDPQALLVVPAATFREGFYLRFLDLKTIDPLIGLLLLGGNLLLFWPGQVAQKRTIAIKSDR